MPFEQDTSVEPTHRPGWMRRVLVQQLDAVARLAAIAWRLIDPKPSPPQTAAAPSLSASLQGLEKAIRLQARISWAMRLIEGLRARLLADLRALDSVQAPPPQIEARRFADDFQRLAAEGPAWFAEGSERSERPGRAERPERLERERFGFERHTNDDLAEILKRPPAEIIALICRELGLPADWPALAEADWRRKAAEGDTTDRSWPPAAEAAPQSPSSPTWNHPAPS